MRCGALLLTALAALACNAILDIPSERGLVVSAPDAGAGAAGAGTAGAATAGAADPSAACHPELDTSDCFRCTDQNCCPQYLDCKADGRCGDFYKECLPDCKATGKTFSQCIVECDGKNGAGHALYAPYFACTNQHCLAPCLNGPPDTCTNCLQASCGDLDIACLGDRECDTLFNCLTTCTGESNFDACTAACKAGTTQVTQGKVNSLLTCAITYCSEPCGSALPF